jgi:hypothetical protein
VLFTPLHASEGASPVKRAFPAIRRSFALNRSVLLMPRSTTRQAIEFVGLIQGSDDHQWLVADAIRDVDTGGRGGVPLHQWTITTEADGPNPTYYVARAHGTEWHAFAPSPRMLAQAIRVGFPRAMRRQMRKDTRNRVGTRPGDGGVGSSSDFEIS